MATLIVSGLGLTGVAASIATALISFAISYIAQSLFAPDAPEAPPDQGVSARIPTDPKNKLPVVYGEQRVAGQTTFADISSDNQKMAFIIALSEGPVQAIDSVTWEDKTLNYPSGIPVGSVGFNGTTGGVTATAPTSRSGGAPLRGDDGDTKATEGAATDENGVHYDFLDGHIKVAVFPNGGRCQPMELFSSRWQNRAALRTMPNVAYAYVELTYDREDRVTGLPSRLYFNVKGREVQTLNSSAQLVPNTVMSTNPVDNLLDYLTNSNYGCKLSKEDLDLPSFLVHKNFCNDSRSYIRGQCILQDTDGNLVSSGNPLFGAPGQSVANGDDPLDAPSNEFSCNNLRGYLTNAGSTAEVVTGTWDTGLTVGSGLSGIITLALRRITATRYTTNGVLNTNNELDRNISDLTVGNGAALTYNLGKFGLISEGVQSVAQRNSVNVSFSEDNIIGKIDITGSGFDAVLNEVTLKFVSKNQRYQQEQVLVELPTSAGIRNPNEPRLEKTMQLPFTNNNVEAERIGRIIINDSRQALIISFQANIDNTDLQAGDIIEISHDTPGWGPGLIGDDGRFANNAECTAVGGTVNGGVCEIDPKQFRVQQVDERVLDQENGSIGVSIIAREYSEDVYNSEELLLEDPSPNSNLPNPLVTPVINAQLFDNSRLVNGVPISQMRLEWTNSTYLDTVDIRYIANEGRTLAEIRAIPDSWTYFSSDGEASEFFLTDLEPNTKYTVDTRARNSLGSNKGGYQATSPHSLTTTSLDSIAPLEVVLTADAGGFAFRGEAAASKEVTATVFILGLAQSDSAHNSFNYRWEKDGATMCLNGNTNDLLDGVVTGSVQDSQAQCESAGGDWDDTRTANEMCHTTSTSGEVFDTTVAGCLIGNRADSSATGNTLTQGSFRTTTLGIEDFVDSAAISCIVSDITQ